MADKQTRIRFVGVDEVSSVMKDIVKTAGGFLVRDVVLASWGKLRDSVTGLASDLVNVNSQWETFNTQFFVQLGRSATATKQRMAELEKFAVKTPFQLAEIIEADRALQVFGLHASNAAQRWGKAGNEIRTIAGDVAAGTKMSFQEISEWMGRFSVGDTGLAIRRFEQMGITTKQELRGMGLEFSKMGELTSPIDEAMTVLLQVMERKFGGLMDIQSRTVVGMKSNLADFMTVQTRLWGEPVFEQYKAGLSGLMDFLNTDGVQNMLGMGRSLFTAATGWLGDVAREWAGWLGGLASDALTWGANIVDSFASGITGSGAVSGALRGLADDITSWLKPGSPPKLLPNLDDWGQGAAESWLSGWTGVTPRIAPILASIGRDLQPFLEQIDLGGSVKPGAMREKLGPAGLGLEGYVASYQRVHDAVVAVAKAKEAMTTAEAGGDQDAIDASRGKLTAAEQEERAARTAMALEKKKITDRLVAEDRLLAAMKAQLAVVQNKEKAESDSAGKAAERAAEAEQRAREQAYLQYRLTVAGTAEGQAAIWEEELKKAEEGSAEWWNIKSRLVELQRKAAKEEGEEVGAAYAGGFTAALEADISGKKRVVPIDWGGIGSAIGESIIDAIAAQAKMLPQKLLTWADALREWASSSDTMAKAESAGLAIGFWLGAGLRKLFGLDSTKEDVKTSILDSLGTALMNAWADLGTLGAEFGAGIREGFEVYFKGFNFWEFLKDLFSGQLEESGGFGQWLKDMIKWTPPSAGVPGLIPGVGAAHATGTFHAPGGWSLVGERGPELVNLPAGSQVLPASQTREALAKAGGNVYIQQGAIQINVANGSAREVGDGVILALRRIGVAA